MRVRGEIYVEWRRPGGVVPEKSVDRQECQLSVSITDDAYDDDDDADGVCVACSLAKSMKRYLSTYREPRF